MRLYKYNGRLLNGRELRKLLSKTKIGDIIEVMR